jgi:hypothetical protein
MGSDVFRKSVETVPRWPNGEEVPLFDLGCDPRQDAHRSAAAREAVAKRLGADESKERFEAKLEKIAKAKVKPAKTPRPT